MKKIISVLLVIVLFSTASFLSSPNIVNGEEAELTFTPQHAEIDFTDYTFNSSNVHRKSNLKNDPWEKVSDGENSYLNFSFDSDDFDSDNGKTNFGTGKTHNCSFFLSANGGYYYSNDNYHIVLQENAIYRVTFRYKVTTENSFSFSCDAMKNGQNNTTYKPQTIISSTTGLANSNTVTGKQSTGNVLSSDGWDIFEIVFKADNLDSTYKNYLRFRFNVNPEAVAFDFSIDDLEVDRLTKLNIVSNETTSSVDIAPPCENNPYLFSGDDDFVGDDISAIVNETNEIYTDGATAEAVLSGAYSDEAYENEISSLADLTANAAGEYTCYKKTFITLDNQCAFLGFDTEPKKRISTGDVGSTPSEENPIPKAVNTFTNIYCKNNGCFTITDSTAYVGNNSLRYVYDATKSSNLEYRMYYIGNTYEYVKEKDYLISFYIKTDTDVGESFDITFFAGAGFSNTFQGGEKTVSITPSKEWTRYSVQFSLGADRANLGDYPARYYYAPGMYLGENAPTLNIDAITISDITDFTVNAQAPQLIENDTAVRFSNTYNSGDGNFVYFSGQQYKITERGTLIKSKTTLTQLNYENKNAADILCVSRTDDYSSCQAYSDGVTTFSAVLDDVIDDGREIVSRGYVVLENNLVFLGNEVGYDSNKSSASALPEGYKLFWGDEFDGNTVDETKWLQKTNEEQTGLIDRVDDTTRKVGAGALQLSAYYDEQEQQYVRAQGLSTKERMNFKYGYIEMRAVIPYKQGSWASFWLNSDSWRNPETYYTYPVDVLDELKAASPYKDKDGNGVLCNIEINFFELQKTGFKPNFHKWYNGVSHALKSNYRPHLTDFTAYNNQYHTYGYLWEENLLVMYLDGNEIYRIELDESKFNDGTPLDCFDTFAYLNLDNDVYSNGYVATDIGKWAADYAVGDIKDSFDFTVDYVRIYQADEAFNIINQ